MRMPLLIDVLTELFNWTLNYEKNLILIWKATVFLFYKSKKKIFSFFFDYRKLCRASKKHYENSFQRKKLLFEIKKERLK